MPEKQNVFLRLKARKALAGHWQTALLIMTISSLLSWASQVASTLQGNDLSSQMLLLLQQAQTSDLIDPNAVLKLLNAHFGPSRLVANLLTLASLLAAPMFTLGVTHYFLELLRGNTEQRWTAVFSRASSWLKGLGLELLMFLKSLAWSLPGLAFLTVVMLIAMSSNSLSGYGASWLITFSIVGYLGAIIPAILAVFRYALSMYFLADHPDWRIRDCITSSKQAMAHQKLNLFMMYLSFFGWSLLISLVGDLVFSMFGQIAYLLVSLALNLALSVYRSCSLCAFYDAWREGLPGTDALRDAGENGTVR